VVEYFGVIFHSPPQTALTSDPMPETRWFDGATLNYAEHIHKGMAGQALAIRFVNERGDRRDITVAEMWREVARFRDCFAAAGVKPGDRLAGYLPNIPEATFAFMAAASMGAVWSCCSPDFGVSSVVDRFAQIEPTVFVAADGYWYNGRRHERLAELEAIRQALPGLRQTLLVPYLGTPADGHAADLIRTDALPQGNAATLTFTPVPFAHPLWILYSSGTTGAPKAITHSHGGCLLEHLKYLAFHNDVHAGETFFWYSTTGWMMWNFTQAAMLHGASIVLYDGSPAYPDMNHLWQLAASLPIHHFGTSAPYIIACMKAGLQPNQSLDLHRLRSIGSTGSPLPPEGFDWVYRNIHDRVWLCSMSGGTDVCTAFVGGVISKPVIRGEIQARGLGCCLFAFDDHGRPVWNEVGDMVITKPMPSMPVFFWNDPGQARYRASYFEDIPGVWRHGDWVEVRSNGGIVIYGRSDATLNRHGIRIGTAEIYRVIDDIPGIEDSLIVNLELAGGRHYMPLFVKLAPGKLLTEDLVKVIGNALRSRCTPRHVPDDVIPVPDIPYTISGKKMEAPVKKILMGMATDKSLNRDAMRNPEALAFFEAFVVPSA
jgi:acetoacetyl-CoA synthetase